jgi:hypothetical protein
MTTARSGKRTLGFCGAVASALLFAGCNLALGLDDLKDRPTDAGHRETATADDASATPVDAGTTPADAGPTFSIGGTVTGLDGSSLALVLGDGSIMNKSLEVMSVKDGKFTFTTKRATGTPYRVSYMDAPLTRQCHIDADSGTVGTTDITTVSVVCVPT